MEDDEEDALSNRSTRSSFEAPVAPGATSSFTVTAAPEAPPAPTPSVAPPAASTSTSAATPSQTPSKKPPSSLGATPLRASAKKSKLVPQGSGSQEASLGAWANSFALDLHLAAHGLAPRLPAPLTAPLAVFTHHARAEADTNASSTGTVSGIAALGAASGPRVAIYVLHSDLNVAALLPTPTECRTRCASRRCSHQRQCNDSAQRVPRSRQRQQQRGWQRSAQQ